MAADAPLLEVRLLGPFEAAVGGLPVPELSARRLRILLAVLAMSAGRPVSIDSLAGAAWGDRLPDNVRRSVQTYVARLRGALGAAAIGTEPAGYVLAAAPDQVDALRFLRLLDEVAADPALERARLDEALALWRGTPFDGLGSAWLDESEAPRLVERYLGAVERRIDLDVAGGRHHDLVALLRELTARHPLREPLWARLLVVLDRCERQAEALERYETIRVRLRDELGVDPGPELQRIHADLLAGRPPSDAPAAAYRVVPRQLPADVAGFAGRRAALAAMDDLANRDAAIIAVTGTAGVGKTALAVRWAHRAAGGFPDGQLYVNLRGFDPGRPAMAPAEAIRGFLDAMAVPAHRIPDGLDAQAGLFRSLLAGKRVLVVLDNARDAEQVRPLLPGAPGCLALVASRNLLTGLVAAENARPLPIDLLTAAEAEQLLANRLGAERMAAEPEAVAEIVERCARLPLALVIVAARSATEPRQRLADLAAELRDTRRSLDAFAGPDAATDPRAVFACSYRALRPEAARLFRLLGLQGGPDIGAPAAASLARVPLPRTRSLLAELTRAHLVAEPSPGRFAAHDLLRAYAAELAQGQDSEDERRAALHRLLDHFLHTAHAAAVALQPARLTPGLTPAQPGVAPERMDGSGCAQAWLTTERPSLLAAVEQAAAAGFDTHAWQLASALTEFCNRQGHWDDLATAHGIGLDCARRTGDAAGEAHAHLGLAAAYGGRDRMHLFAQDHLRCALELFAQVGDRAGQARAHRDVAWLHDMQGRHREALHHDELSLALLRAAGDRPRQVLALNNVGWQHAQLGHHREALSYCELANALAREIGNRHDEAMTLDSLAYAHRHLGRHAEAVDCYRRAIDLFVDLGDPFHQARSLDGLGDLHRAAGDEGAARDAWRRAFEVFDQLGHPWAAPVRAKLGG